jgi:hypothetical protein
VAAPLTSSASRGLLRLSAYALMYYAPIYGLYVTGIFASMALTGSVFCSLYIRYLIAIMYGRYLGLPLRFASFLDRCRNCGIFVCPELGISLDIRKFTII